jgi:hypothetical protein
MERRLGARVSTDFGLAALRDGIRFEGRAVDLSASGALIRSRTQRRRPPLIQRLELNLGPSKSLSTLARTVWSNGAMQAVRFVGLCEVDRLEIAEHLDAMEGRRRCSLRSR